MRSSAVSRNRKNGAPIDGKGEYSTGRERTPQRLLIIGRQRRRGPGQKARWHRDRGRNRVVIGACGCPGAVQAVALVKAYKTALITS